MPAATKLTPEMFVGLARQSGLIDAETLRLALREIRFDSKNVADTPLVADLLVERQLLTRWQADKLLQGRNKGFLLGKYRLLSHLGTGGMSAVYLAEHRLMRRRVAIKVLPKASARGASHLERFHKEAQAVAALDHRNIVRAYDVDQEGDIHFLVMEYVSGRSLQDIVASEGPFPPIPAAEYIRQAAEGLNQAHKSNLVHRDIKPANLLLDDRGTIKVLDLGLVRFFDERDDSSITRRHDEKVLGTADYLSPEQALDSHSVDVRSDVYSLGCTFFFLLAGHPPFSEGTLAARLLAHQTKEPPSLTEIAPQVPAGLVAIVRRMMAKRPEDRFQSARDVAQVLADWLREHGGDTWAEMHPVVGGAVAGLPYGSSSSSSPTGAEAGGATGSSTAPVLKPGEPPRPSSGADWSAGTGWNADSPSVIEEVVLPVPEVVPVGHSPLAPPAIDNRAVPGIGSDEEQSPEFAAFLRRTSEASEPAGGHPSGQPGTPSSAPTPESIPASLPAAPSPPLLPGSPASDVGTRGQTGATAASSQESPSASPLAGDDALADTRVLSAPAVPTPPAVTGHPEAPLPDSVSAPRAPGESVPPAPAAAASVPGKSVPTPPPARPNAPVASSPPPASAEGVLAEFADDEQAAASHETLVMQAVRLEPQSPAVAPTGPSPGPVPRDTVPPDTVPPGVNLPAADSLVPPQDVESGADPAPAWIVETERPSRRASRGGPRSTPAPARALPREAAVSPPRSPGSAPDSRRRLWWIVGANLLLTLLTLGIWFTWGPGKSKPAPDSSKTGSTDRTSAGKGKGAGKKKGAAKTAEDDIDTPGPTVSASRRDLRVGPSETYKSLAAALAEAKNFRPSSRSARQTITLPAGVLAERITVDQTWPRGLIIKGQGTVLAPAGAEPVVSVIASQGELPNFQLEGVEIDASGKETAIRLGGNLEASRFVDLTIRGFSREAVVLEGVQSFGGVPVIFERLTIQGAAQPTAVGFELIRRGEQGNNRIRLRGCRLLGPLAAGIRARDDALDVEVEETIFHQARIGLHLLGANPNWRNLLLASNTFYQVGQGVVFDNMPGTATGGLSFFNNLFVESSERDAVVSQGFNEAVFLQMFASNPGGIDFNWTTRPAANPPAPNEIPSLFSVRSGRYGVQPQFVSVDPASEDFLRPAPGSPQGNVGQAEALFPKKRFGNQIGAVRPR